MCAICFGPRAVREVTGELQISGGLVGAEAPGLVARAISNDPGFDPTVLLADTPRLRPWTTDPADSYGAGRTELIAQSFNNTLNRYEFTGQQNIDAVLIGSRWTITNMTFSFPTDGSFYDNEGYPANSEPDELVVFNAAQQNAVRYALGLVGQYTNLTFTEVTESASVHGDLRFGQTGFNDVSSAYANFPSSSPQSGDVWFGMTNQPFYDTPQIGNWGMATQLHEIGHALGLKHGHDNYTNVDLDGYLDDPEGGGPRFGSVALPSNQDGQAWSLMTYRSNPGAAVTFQGDGSNQPQTYMQNDIAALQHLYGANFNTQSGNTTYTWDNLTGTMSINGVAQATPTSNKILMTLWDGNGVDTYDLSNYDGGVAVNLNPGGFSTFSLAQLVDHQPLSGTLALAPGNVANALLYQGDERSLIENAIGGIGNDILFGNQAANVLTGGAGVDSLIGSIGDDILNGGSGNDTLYGDAKPAQTAGIGFGDGVVVKGSGAGNTTYQTAIDVTNEFSLDSNANIINSTTTPHVTVQGTGDNNRDYYKLTVAAGTVLTFDTDLTTGGIDTYLRLLDSNGNVLAFDDDSATSEGAGGSTTTADSLIQFTVLETGTYIIEVGEFPNSNPPAPIGNGATYELQISAAGTPALGAGSGVDTLIGGLGAGVLEGGAGADTLDGGADSDTASYTGSAAGVHVSLLAGAGQFGDAAGDVLSGIENLAGSAFDDQLTGDAGVNVLSGGGGADLLLGGAGGDTLAGGDGSDTASYATSAGAVRIRMFAGTAELNDAAGDVLTSIDNLIGSAFNDQLSGDAGDNIIEGGAGADTLGGREGFDTLSYAGSSARVVVNLANRTSSQGDAQGDVFTSAFEAVIGSAFSDTLNGGNGDQTIEGGLGNDALNGGNGYDTLSYRLATTGVTVNLLGGTATGMGSDAISGFERVIGSGFNDSLTGDAGDNVLIGGAGADALDGGGGNDLVDYSGSSAEVTVNLAAGSSSGGHAQGDALTSIEHLIGSAFADILTGNASGNILTGGAGGDQISGGGGLDTAVYAGSNAAVTINLGAGTASGGHAQGDTLTSIENLVGSAFDDVLIGRSGNNVFDGGAGGDVIDGEGGIDTVSYANSSAKVTVRLYDGVVSGGDAAGDIISDVENLIGSRFSDVLHGSSVANRLEGGLGNDFLYGREGDDVLIGGIGTDRLNGGSGADLFVFGAADLGVKTIQDFSTVSGDIIRLDPAQFTDFADVMANTTDDGLGNTVISKGGIAITLTGVLKAQLSADDCEIAAPAPALSTKDGALTLPGLLMDDDPLILPHAFGPLGKGQDDALILPPLDDGLDPLILPAGLEGKTLADEAPVICQPGEGGLPSIRPDFDLLEMGLSNFDGRDPHRFLMEPRFLDWVA